MTQLTQLARKVRSVIAAILIIFSFAFVASWASGQEKVAPTAPVAFVLDVKDAIGVGTAFYIQNGLEEAKARSAGVVILQMDTPGGLVSATREIIKTILSSPIPIIVYIAPTGARAASAGTYLAYAAHVAAMAPGTHLGAATPVSLGTPITPSPPAQRDDKANKAKTDSAMQKKVLNDAVAYIRSLAQLRGRNADWAEKAVLDAATMTADEALKNNVVDVVARNVPDLLQQVEGRIVPVGKIKRPLSTKNASIVEYESSWKAKFLSAITNPNIAFILLLVGFYGIVFEFWTPGLGGSGIVGAICLLVAFAALSMLPLNYAGLGLLLLGMGFMIAEGLAPGVGILGIGGIVAFVLGGMFLFDPRGADIDFRVAWPVIISTVIATALLFVVGLGMVMRVRRQKVVSGAEYMLDSPGIVIAWDSGEGRVLVQGETWSAKSAAPLTKGQNILVKSRNGLTLKVEPSNEEL